MDAAAIQREREISSDPLILGVETGPGFFQPQILRAPPKVQLAGLARESARSCPVQPQTTQFSFQGEGPFHSHELLSLLTLSYATRLFTLERIYESLRDEIIFRGLLSTSVPHPTTVRAFRRQERASLVSSLETFFQRFFSLTDEDTDDSDQLKAWTLAVGFKSSTFAREPSDVRRMVIDRINQATWTDKMLLDF